MPSLLRMLGRALAVTPVFDIVNGTAGFATVKLRTAYAGACLRIRRTGGSPGEQDIGFSGTALDTASLLSYVGANDGFVVTWYDQSGNGFDMAIATAPLQPQLVSGGSLITTIGGKPSLDFDGTDDYLQTGVAMSSLVTAGAGTIMSVFNADTLPSPAGFVYDDPATWADSLGFLGAHVAGGVSPERIIAYNWDGSADLASATIAAGTSAIHVWRHTAGTLYSYLNSSTAANSTASGNTTDLTGVLRVGRQYSTAYYDGKRAALLCWDTALSADDLTAVGRSLGSTFGITWS
jgi:hypothetical protein